MTDQHVPDPAVPAALIALAGGRGRVLWHGSVPWASAGFVGTRDEVAIEFLGADAAAAGDAMLAALGEAEFALPRRIVADVAIGHLRRVNRPQKRTVAMLELLLVED